MSVISATMVSLGILSALTKSPMPWAYALGFTSHLLESDSVLVAVCGLSRSECSPSLPK